MKLIINVEELNSIIPQYEYRKPPTLNLDVEIALEKTEKLFYKIWEWVEDEQLRKWIEAEGYELKKKENEYTTETCPPH